MAKEFIVSGDSHVVEPVDLYKTRLPKNMRDQALWEEDTILDEPLVPGGHTEFRTVHTTGYEGWTVSRYRQFPGPTPDGLPSSILRDLDRDGVDASMLFPNLSFFALYTDDHERSIAHARVYNDWLAETYLPYSNRLRPAAAIPTTNVADGVKEIERAVRLGLSALILPEIPQPLPYWAPEYEPLWAAAEANGLPMRIIADLVSSGACDRHPNLMFNVIEFNAGWLANYMGSMDKAWRTGTGQDPHWWLGFWDDGVDPHDQKLMGRMFKINDRWPLPLKPSEYVKRNIRVQFADDQIAVMSRHITGADTIYWGSDYPHAEGTFLGSQAVIEEQFAGVPDPDRAKILGGNLAKIVGFDDSKKLAPVTPPASPKVPAPL
jgi:predicted TIM-barrel fold metal-dependent hydrolase